MGITTKDLAKLCGVSRTTIHRALNGTGRINPDTKEMILRVANENDYRPDILARALVKGQTFYIGIVVLDVNNRYFSQMLSAIGSEVNKRGYCINITLHGNNKEMEKEQIARLADYHVDGIIISSVNEGAEYKEYLQSLDIPVVSVDNKITEDIPFVGIDQKMAMKEAVERVIKKGYKKVAFVCPPMKQAALEQNMYVHKERMAGFKEAVEETPGIEAEYLLDWTYLEEAEKLVNDPTKIAFLCTADNFALDIMKTMRKVGKKTPKDYGIVGFDNIDTLEYVLPRLSTISNSVEEVADTAVNILFDLIEEKQRAKETWKDSSNICEILPYEFIEGETL